MSRPVVAAKALPRLKGERHMKCIRCTHEWRQELWSVRHRAEAFCAALLEKLSGETLVLALAHDRDRLTAVVTRLLESMELRPRVCPACHSPYWDRDRIRKRHPLAGWASGHKPAPKPKS